MAAARDVLATACCLKSISTEKWLETSSVYTSLAPSLPERGVSLHAVPDPRPHLLRGKASFSQPSLETHPRQGVRTLVPACLCRERPQAGLKRVPGQGRSQVGLPWPGRAGNRCSPALAIHVQVHEMGILVATYPGCLLFTKKKKNCAAQWALTCWRWGAKWDKAEWEVYK